MSEPINKGVAALVDPNGGVVEADEANLPKLLDSGYRLASEDEVSAERQRLEYGTGIGNEAAAFAESAASGATMGLYDVAAKTLSDDYAEGLAARREYNPTAAGVGEVAGLLGATLATGGVGGAAAGAARGGSLAARGGSLLARTVTAPARGLMSLGEAATAKTAQLLGAETAKGMLGQAVRSGAAYGVGGAIEGALFGAAKAVTDDYLTDHEITAERIWAGADAGAVLGGALGGGMGAATGLLGGAARKFSDIFNRSDADKAAAASVDNALALPESVADATAVGGARAEARVTSAEMSADQKVMQQLGYQSDDQVLAELSMNPTSIEQRSALERVQAMGAEGDAARKFGELQQTKTNSIVDAQKELAKIADELDPYIGRNAKLQAVKDALDVSMPEWTPAKAEAVVSRVQSLKDDLAKRRGDASLFKPEEHQAMQDVINGADTVLERLTGVKKNTQGPVGPDARSARFDRDAIAELFMAEDDLKGWIGRASRKAGRNSPQVGRAEAALQRDYMATRANLEADDIYGPAVAQMQRATNAVESEYIRTARAMEKNFVLDEADQLVRSGQHGFDTLSQFSDKKIGSFLNAAGKAENRQLEELYALGLQRQLDLLKTKSDFYRVPPEKKALLARAEELKSQMLADVREIRTTKVMADKYAEQLQSLRDVPGVGETLAKLKISLSKAAKITGDVATDTKVATKGGSAEAAVEAAGAARSSAATRAVRRAMEGEKSIGSAVKGVVKWARDTSSKAATTAVDTARKATRPTLLGVNNFVATDPVAYERLVQNVNQLQDPNSDARRAARSNTFELQQVNPELANALEAHTQRVADFLSSKAGPLHATPKAGDPWGGTRKPRHDPAKVEKFARYVEAATNPGAVLKRIGNNEFRREDIETLQALYPKLYQRVVADVLEEVFQADKMPPYAVRLRVGHLLNAPADPSMTPEYLRTVQEIAASGVGIAAEKQANGPANEPVLSPGNRREPKLGTMYATQTQLQSVQGSRL